MLSRVLKNGVHWVGAMDWDRRLFDALIPLPDGTSYNAYLVAGQREDRADRHGRPGLRATCCSTSSGVGVKRLDYVVSHHAEQDHSGVDPRGAGALPGGQGGRAPRRARAC